MHRLWLRPVPVPGLHEEVGAQETSEVSVDPLLRREGTYRYGWQPAADALLTMERPTEPVAAAGNGFCLFSRFPGAVDLPSIAAGCNPGAPQRLHRVPRDLVT